MTSSPLEAMVWVDVGWVAFLALCCALPTACARCRRRKEAREERAEFSRVQSRLAELERWRDEGGGGDAAAEERRPGDWECLEQLFEEMPTSSSDNAVSRLLIAMLDAWISVFRKLRIVRGRGRDRRQRREWGQRLVAALKTTSVAVREQHLIAMGARRALHESEEDDIEVGIDGGDDADQDAAPNSPPDVVAVELGDGNEARAPENVRSRCDSETERRTQKISEDPNNIGGGAEPTTTTESLPSTSRSLAADVLESNRAQKTAGGDPPSPRSVTAAPTYVPQPSDATNATLRREEWESCEFHDTGEGESDDIDCDNKYSALCLPCVGSSDFPNPSGPLRCPQDESGKKMRVVSPSCAICLGRYRPGNVVSWSANRDCPHVFHRDCILLWLMRKEECPCCRREFVLESASGDGAGKVGSIRST